MNEDEDAVRAVIEKFAAALHAKDAKRAVALISEDAVTFDLAPPLAIGPAGSRDRAMLEHWFATWRGPIESTPRDIVVAVGGDIAWAHGLRRLSGTKSDGEHVDMWFRATACLRREDGRWQIAHMHNSVPFAMDGSAKALLDLAP